MSSENNITINITNLNIVRGNALQDSNWFDHNGYDNGEESEHGSDDEYDLESQEWVKKEDYYKEPALAALHKRFRGYGGSVKEE